jgi:hypothetical protein
MFRRLLDDVRKALIAKVTTTPNTWLGSSHGKLRLEILGVQLE